jgi:hypothetical protein
MAIYGQEVIEIWEMWDEDCNTDQPIPYTLTEQAPTPPECRESTEAGRALDHFLSGAPMKDFEG